MSNRKKIEKVFWGVKCFIYYKLLRAQTNGCVTCALQLVLHRFFLSDRIVRRVCGLHCRTAAKPFHCSRTIERYLYNSRFHSASSECNIQSQMTNIHSNVQTPRYSKAIMKPYLKTCWRWNCVQNFCGGMQAEQDRYKHKDTKTTRRARNVTCGLCRGFSKDNRVLQ